MPGILLASFIHFHEAQEIALNNRQAGIQLCLMLSVHCCWVLSEKDRKEGACTLHFSPLSPQREILAELTAEMSPLGGGGDGAGEGAVEVAMNHP